MPLFAEYVSKRGPNLHESQLSNHFIPQKTEGDKKKPLRPSSTAEALSLSSPMGVRSPGGTSATDTKGRLVKKQGYLDLEVKVEESGVAVQDSKQHYWFEVLGGYLNWYANEAVAGAGHVSAHTILVGYSDVTLIYISLACLAPQQVGLQGQRGGYRACRVQDPGKS